MANSCRYLLCILWVIVLFLFGVGIFTKGFLLTRFVITDNSTCLETPVTHSPSPRQGCWLPKTYIKAIIIIVDALRFDFVAYNHSLPDDQALPYQNKLKYMDGLIQNQSQNTRLYHFIADPPTTTLQRLKGMTTGSLPTFVDVASNFDSSAISEDNLIDQLTNQHKSITFMGDDTWTSLFPGRFKRSFPYPSFNVKDLHTVDNGVLDHLLPEIGKEDWDVLIGHFLGVDHCGHRYGPNHPEMAAKLTQMDGVVRSVVEAMRDDTVLFVLGDHGMTRTGDHGGDSWDELHAALFVYSPTPLQSAPKTKNTFAEVSQIDLVPTLSLLLGLPIPFPSLGSVIPDLFAAENNSLRLETVLRVNAHQVRNYINTYANYSEEFPRNKLDELENLYAAAERDFVRPDKHTDPTAIKLYSQYLMKVKRMCQDVWAKFDLSCMISGIALVCSALLLSYWCYDLLGNPTDAQDISLLLIGVAGSVGFAVLVVLLVVLQVGVFYTATLIFLTIVSVLLFAVRIMTYSKPLKESLGDWYKMNFDVFPLFCILVYFSALFSNSYVVYEDAVSAFLLQSMMVYKAYCIVSNMDAAKDNVGPPSSSSSKKKKPQKYDIMRSLTSPVSLTVLLTIAGCLLVRLSTHYRVCREEQWTCELSSTTQSLSEIPEEFRQYKNIRYFATVGLVACLPFAVHRWMRHYGNMNGHTPPVICVRYLIPFGYVALFMYWALQALPSRILDKLPVWQTTLFPRLVYASVLTSIGCILASPLAIYVVRRQSNKDPLPAFVSGSNVVPRMFEHLKSNWRMAFADSTDETPPPLVYGLGTVYSATLITALSALALLLLMLLGDGLAPSLLLGLGVLFVVLELDATRHVTAKSTGFPIDWSSVLSLGLFASSQFYSTGHQTTVTTIQWHAAFHGFHGDFDTYVAPVLLVTANTFCSTLVGLLGLPLLAMWPRVRGNMVNRFTGTSDRQDSRGEFTLFEDQAGFWAVTARLWIGALGVSGIKLLGTMCCALIHRRHLMVWKIFAPRFLFEAVGFVVTGVVSICVYLFIMRVNKSLSNWTKTLEKPW